MAVIGAVELDTYQKMADKRKYEAKVISPKAHTMVCLFELFRERIKELRVGPDVFIVGKNKETNQIRQRNHTTLGVPSNLRHFLTGLGWDVQVRGTLSKYSFTLCRTAILTSNSKHKFSEKIWVKNPPGATGNATNHEVSDSVRALCFKLLCLLYKDKGY